MPDAPAPARSRLADLGSLVLGWVLVALGAVLWPLPGPGTVVVVAGLALLARHYVWAQRLLGPMQAKAVEAGRASVASIPRIVVTALGGVWLMALGVLWWISPEIPEADVLGWHVGPRLPAAGKVTAAGLAASALAAWALLAYSVRRFR